MIEVLTRGKWPKESTIYTTSCRQCGSLLRCTDQDVIRYTDDYYTSYNYIVCPVCKYNIMLRKEDSNG